MNFRDYRDLKVWQKSMELVLDAYELTKSLPDTERSGLISQIQRSASSAPANIAEGHAIGLPKPFLRHLRITAGSIAELETHCLLATKLNYADGNRVERVLERAVEVRRMLLGLQASIRRRMHN